MKFSEVIERASDLLQRKERLSYRTLKLEFDLNEEQLEALKEELIDVQELAVDKDGKMLVWRGDSSTGSAPSKARGSFAPATPPAPPPASYTPLHLAERIRAEQAVLEARSGTDGERKTITALFADLKGSTALIEGLDPEEARAIIDPALQLMMEAVHQYEGYVAQALGDGIFALFGAPIAHEDHPQRALFAALRMQEAMRRYADTLRQKGYPPLLMRVGVNTGEVVVRSIRKDDLHTDYVPVGHSTNLAARMEQLANPGTIVVSSYTQRLTDGYFAFKDLGPTQIKGVEEAVNIHEVLGVGPQRTRLQVAARRGLTRFVGRQTEMEQLRKALDHATAGHGQIVGVMSEPGLGKSRLIYEFKLHSQNGCLILEAYSVSHGKASPYLPVIELLKSYFDLTPQDEERQRRGKITEKVLSLDHSLEDTLPYLFALLGLPDSTASLQLMDAQIRRRRTFEALKKLFLRESLNQPLILIFEDLHWIDSETQGFLDTLSEGVASTRLLLLVNYRPEYRHEWGSKTYYSQLRLAPLGKEEAEDLMTFLLGSDPSLKALKHLILEKTEGTPFFMEEVVQTLAEEGVLSGERGQYRLERALTALHISPTVQGVLAARIDRLAADEKALLHHLAVVGRQFPLSLVRQVIPQTEEELYRLLSSLQRKEFLYEQPAFPEVEYLFKHALTQEVAYNSVLLERRKTLHERTAQAIEGLFHSKLEDRYSELAHHYGRSGNTQKAVDYLQRAGQQAVQRSANAEAITHLTAALGLLKTFPDTPERTQQELTLQLALGMPLQATKGIAAPEVGKVYTRVLELCRQVGEPPQLFSGLVGLRRFYLLRAELRTAYELGEQLLSLAQEEQDSLLLLEAYYAIGFTLLCLGEFNSAQEYLKQGVALYDAQQHHSPALSYGYDPGVWFPTSASLVRWYLGYPDQALKSSREALTPIQRPAHPFSLGWALNVSAWLHQYRREAHGTQEQAEAAITLSTERGFPQWLAMGTILRGWALAAQGQGEEGIAQMREGLTAYRATGAEQWRPYFLALLAEAYGKVGQAEDGLVALAEALTVVDKSGERFYEAELYRLKGQLTLQKLSVVSSQLSVENSRVGSAYHDVTVAEARTVGGAHPTGDDEAEVCFLKAIEIARQQQAKSLELRAATSFARLWQRQGKQQEAHRLLYEVYSWFTEGFDTTDLQEAKALLNELGE